MAQILWAYSVQRLCLRLALLMVVHPSQSESKYNGQERGLLAGVWTNKSNDVCRSQQLCGTVHYWNHPSTLIFAAMDTTSKVLAHSLHILAQYPNVQWRLCQEITNSQASVGDLNYNDSDLGDTETVIIFVLHILSHHWHSLFSDSQWCPFSKGL